MSDEVLGNVYEVITLIAIEDFTSSIQSNEKIFWHEIPEGVSIEPDLTIGLDKDNPRILIQVSHTNAGSASHHKFWRNIGEFVDARLALGNSTTIANVVFDSIQKRNLALVSESLFDGFIEADKKPYGEDLLELANTLAGKISNSSIVWMERAAFIRRYLLQVENARNVIKSFAEDLADTFLTSSKFSSGWYSQFQQINENRISKKLPSAQKTSVRRGLGRLLPINSEEQLRKIIDSCRNKKTANLPHYFNALELSKKSLIGEVVSDEEILGLVNLLSTETIVELWKELRIASQATKKACKMISVSDKFSLFHDFISSHVEDFSDPETLQQALDDCYENPDFVLGENIGLDHPESYGAWLFDYIMTLIKAHSGKQQGYGYNPLAREAGLLIPGKRSILDFALPKYISRSKPLPKYVSEGISNALSIRISKLRVWIKNNEITAAKFYLRGLFEDKIYKMAAFDPLRVLIEAKLPDKAQYISRYPTGLTDLIDAGSATCSVISISETLILWQSASASHCNDKTKELMGRAGMLRLKGDAVHRTFYSRDKVKKLLLMLDGDWTDRHLIDLKRSGFDGIFYPHDVDNLLQEVI